MNFTIVKGHLFATAPLFLGANPAKVPSGSLQGTRALADKEDQTRRLVKSMIREQFKKTVFQDQVFLDIVTGSDRNVSPLAPAGLA